MLNIGKKLMNTFYKKSVLSVSMILFNRWEVSKKCILSIKNTVPEEWRIQWSVIDNGSQDKTKDEALKFLEDLNDEIILFQRLEEPVKATMVANRSINHCTGQLILRTDNDIEYTPGWFEDCFKILTDPAFSDLAFICPTHHLKQAISGYKPHLVNGSFSKVDMFPYVNGMNVPINVLAKTATMKEIGGLYTPYNLLHCDVHHCLLVKNMGYKFGYAWDTQCKHIGDVSENSEYYHKSRHERFSEDARFNLIAKGDFKDKHPQEIEFVHQISEMKKRYIPKLPKYDLNLLFLGAKNQNLISVLEMSKTDRVNFKYEFIDETNPVEVINACKQNSVNYLFPIGKKHYEFAHSYKKEILRSVGTECIVVSSDNIQKIFDLTFLDEMGIGKNNHQTIKDFYVVNLVSDRRFDIVSLVALRCSGLDSEVVNHLHFYSFLNKISHHLQLFGPWSVGYQLADDKMDIITFRPFLEGEYLVTEKAGQNQFQISLKVLERDFFGYHYRYIVDWGLKFKSPSLFYYEGTPCLKRLS